MARTDIVLIQPPVETAKNEILSRMISPSIGLAYIAAYQRSLGREVKVIDAHVEQLEVAEVVARVRRFAPEVVGITAFTYQLPGAVEVAKGLKKIMPSMPIALGGSHASAVPESTLEELEAFDAVVKGEGEIVLGDVYDAGVGGTDIAARPGLYTRSGDVAISRRPPEEIVDLDALPFPAFDLFPWKSYRPFYSRSWLMELPMSASRGCPFECVFCHDALGRHARFRSPECLVDELEKHMKDFGVEQVIFSDENLTLRRSLIEGFCEEVIRRGHAGKVRFICESRVQVARETLGLMARAGFSHVAFGIEAGNQEILDKAKKKITLEQSRQAIRDASEAGLVTDGNFVLGLPYETEKTIRETIEFACSLPLDYLTFFKLVPYPGSEVLEMARRGEGNLRLVSDDWSRYGKHVGSAIELTTVTPKRLAQLQLEGYLRFYGHPRRWRSVLRKMPLRSLVAFATSSVKQTLLAR